jgi:hypothetical protein
VIARGAVFAGRLTSMAWHHQRDRVFLPLVSFVRCLVRGSVHFLPTASAVIAIERNEDNDRGLYNSLGAFADASHFARVCLAYTGQTPTAWRHMSQTFCLKPASVANVYRNQRNKESMWDLDQKRWARPSSPT